MLTAFGAASLTFMMVMYALERRVSLSLADLVNEIASRHPWCRREMLGDGVHFHFKDPHDAVMASLEIVNRVQPTGRRRRISA